MIGHMTPRRSRLLLSVAATGLVATGLVGCGAETDPAATSDEDAAPTSIPAAAGPVHTWGPVLVLQDGPEAVACLGSVAYSAPPQCTGQPLAGWDWTKHPEHSVRDSVRWGDFALTGTWDGETLEVTEAVPAAEYDSEPETEESPGTPCSEPEGGWRVVDEAKASSASLDETLRRAGQLPGYAESWLDTNDTSRPEEQILNVRVTSDVRAAEDALRETWGGPLCVQEARYDEAQLVELTTELQELPGVLDTSAWGDVVALAVVHDDGSVQEWVDDRYGEGRVEVRSALVAAPG